MLHTLHFFSSSKFYLFHNATFFGSCIIHILCTGCVKIQMPNFGAKRLIQFLLRVSVSTIIMPRSWVTRIYWNETSRICCLTALVSLCTVPEIKYVHNSYRRITSDCTLLTVRLNSILYRCALLTVRLNRILYHCALLTERLNRILYHCARNFTGLLHCALSCVYELRIW
jgi:hypothetical protein